MIRVAAAVLALCALSGCAAGGYGLDSGRPPAELLRPAEGIACSDIHNHLQRLYSQEQRARDTDANGMALLGVQTGRLGGMYVTEQIIDSERRARECSQ